MSQQNPTLEDLWRSMSDNEIIKEVILKGRNISRAIEFIARKNETDVESTKDYFFDITHNYIDSLVHNLNFFRARRILENMQINATHYLFSLHKREILAGDTHNVAAAILDHIKSAEIGFDKHLPEMDALFALFSEVMMNQADDYVSAAIDSLSHLLSAPKITSANMSKLKFWLFMKQPVIWRNVSSCASTADCFPTSFDLSFRN